MKNRIWAGIVAVALAVGGSVAVATPASAHTSNVSGVAVCQPDGTYTVEWTYNAVNVPNGIEAETKAMTTNKGSLAPIDGINKGGQIFLSVWSDHQINVPGAPVKTGNWSAKFKTVGVPGNYVGDITTMVQTDWRGGPSEDPVGKVRVDGTCKPPRPEQPAPLQGRDDVPSAPVCVEPKNGKAIVTTTSTTWTQAYVWNDSKGWVLGDKVYSEPVIGTSEIDSPDCVPPFVPNPVAHIQDYVKCEGGAFVLDALGSNVDITYAINGVKINVPAGTAVHTDADGSLIQPADGKYIVTASYGETQLWSKTFKAKSVKDCHVPPTPAPVVFTDISCDAPGSIDITETEGVAYLFSVDGGPKAHISDMTIPEAALPNIGGKLIVIEAVDLKTDEVLGTWEHTFNAPTDCEVPPTAANPTAVLTATCGEAGLVLTNPLVNDANQLTASFVVFVDGEYYDAYSVEAGNRAEESFTFAEDSGDHLIEVYQAGTSEWKLIASADVTSDCEVVVPPTEPPTEEPPTTEPPTEQPPTTTTVVKAPVKKAPVATDELAQTGGDATAPILWGLGGLMALIAGGALVFTRRHVASKQQ